MRVSCGLVSLLLLALLAACAPAAPRPASVLPEDRAEIAARLEADIAVLASDAMAGREPGTPGGRDASAWIEQRMGEAGLVSGTNDPGSYWRLPVDLLGVDPQTSQLVLTQGRRRVVIPAADAAVYTPRRRALAFGGPGTGVPVVFVGYGDGSVLGDALAGAVAVMLADPGRDQARTVVADAGALAAVRSREGRARLQLASEEEDNLAAYITDKAFAEVIGARRWAAWKAEAKDSAFSPIELNLSVSLEATSDRREFASQNIIGMIPGSAPGSGAVLVLGHWDHLGECGPPARGRRRGAISTSSPPPPRKPGCSASVPS